MASIFILCVGGCTDAQTHDNVHGTNTFLISALKF